MSCYIKADVPLRKFILLYQNEDGLFSYKKGAVTPMIGKNI